VSRNNQKCENSISASKVQNFSKNSFQNNVHILKRISTNYRNQLIEQDRGKFCLRFSDEEVTDIPEGKHGPSPYKIDNILSDSWNHPNVLYIEFCVDGLQNGFNLNFQGDRNNPCEYENHGSTKKQMNVLIDKWENLIKKERAQGFFETKPIPNLFITPCGLIPKKEGGWRMIRDMSFGGDSINSNTEKAKLSYDTTDLVVETMTKAEKKAYLIKFDVAEAFETLRARKADWHLGGAYIPGRGYVFSTSLTFGNRHSPAIWENIGELLRWLLINIWNIKLVCRWVDDYLVIGNNNLKESIEILNKIKTAGEHYGFPLHKFEGPTTIASFNGVEYNTETRSMAIPKDKLEKGKIIIQKLINKNYWSLKKTKSLIGLLFHFSKVCFPGRAFVKGILAWRFKMWGKEENGKTKPKSPSNRVRRDIQWWNNCLKQWKGRSWMFLRNKEILQKEAKSVWYIDASPLWGIGLWSENGTWGNVKFPPEILEYCTVNTTTSSTRMEYFGPLVLLATFGPWLTNGSHIVFMDAKTLESKYQK